MADTNLFVDASDRTVLCYIEKECKLCKEQLTANEDYLVQLRMPTFEFSTRITRGDLEISMTSVLEKIEICLRGILEGITEEVEEVVLVGGCSRITAIQKVMRKVLVETGHSAFVDREFCCSISPEEAVAQVLL